MSNNLNITDITTGQNQKETTANNQKGDLDAAITETIDEDITSGNVTVSDANYRACIYIQVIGATTGGRTVTLPAIKRLVAISSRASDATVSFGVVVGSTTIEVPAGAKVVVYTDGTANGLFLVSRDQTYVVVPDSGELTIATGVVTPTGSYHTIDTQSDDASDDLDTITAGIDGQMITISPADSTRDVVVKDGIGNIECAGDFTMDNIQDIMVLRYDATTSDWIEISRSSNGA